jgi:hypothetical protein
VRLILIAAIAAGGCNGLYGTGVALGDSDVVTAPGCKIKRTTGALALDEHHRIRAVREGKGEVWCEGEEYPETSDVRQAARIELEIYGPYVYAGKGWYAYTTVYDAHGNILEALDDAYVWSAQNAEVHPGVCDGPKDTNPNCARAYQATFVAQPGRTTISVRYRGATGSLTFPVLPKR